MPLSSIHQSRALFQAGQLKVLWHSRLEQTPPELPSTTDVADKVEGMLLGLAIGDALGNVSESINPSDRRRKFGWIESYLPNRHAGGRAVGLPSDDTQLAFWTIEQQLEKGHLDPARLGEMFSERRIFGIGQAVSEFVANFRSRSPWHRCGSTSAGNGALMRIAPVLLPHLTRPTTNLWGDTLLAAHLTHNDGLSNASCLVWVDLLWALLGMQAPPPPNWWVSRSLAVLDDVCTDRPYAARNGHPAGFNGTAAQLIRQHLVPALDQGNDVLEACATWHSGAYLLETLPTALYIVARHGDDPRTAMLQAVNNTRDNDTVAAIVGAAIGALHGASCWPSEWIDGLLGRTNGTDDGEIFRLILAAGETFGFGSTDLLRSRAAT